MDSEFEDEEFDQLVQEYCRQVMQEKNKQQLQKEKQVMQEKLEVKVTQEDKSQQPAQIINLSQFSYVPQENQNNLIQPNNNQSQPLIINQKFSQGISQKEKSSQLKFSQNQGNKSIFTVKFINADTFSVQYVNGTFSQEQIEYFKNKFITVNFQKAQNLEASIFEYESIIQEFSKQKNNSITQPPLAIFKFFKYQIPFSEKTVNYDYSKEQIKTFKDLPEELQNKLYTFQKEGVNYVLGRFGRALIGDEMGVGKTMQAIASVTAYYSEWPVLVLCPSMLCCNWRNEILNHLGFLVEANKVQIIKTGSTKFQKNKNFYIISYDMAKNMAQAILAEDIKVIICDESHYLKEPQTQRFKNICPILQGCRRLILLSGTPMISRPKEIFTQISCIRPDIFNNFKVFGQRYCDPKPDKWNANAIDYSGASNTEELNLILTQIMVRRTKQQVLTELPEKQRTKIEIEVNQEKANYIQKILSDAKINLRQLEARKNNDPLSQLENIKFTNEQNSALTLAYSATAEAKMDGIKKWVIYLIENKYKFLVFSHHTNIQDMLRQTCQEKGVQYIHIDGSYSVQKRQQQVDDFQSKESVRVAILSLKAAGVGFTLTAASLVVMAEMY